MVIVKKLLLRNRKKILKVSSRLCILKFIRDLNGEGVHLGIQGVYTLDYSFLGEVKIYKLKNFMRNMYFMSMYTILI